MQNIERQRLTKKPLLIKYVNYSGWVKFKRHALHDFFTTIWKTWSGDKVGGDDEHCLLHYSRDVLRKISGQIRPTVRRNWHGQTKWQTNRDRRKFPILGRTRQNNAAHCSLPNHQNGLDGGRALLVFLDSCHLLRIAQIKWISQGRIVIWAKYLLWWNRGWGINKHAEPLWENLPPALSAFRIAANPPYILHQKPSSSRSRGALGLTIRVAMMTVP